MLTVRPNRAVALLADKALRDSRSRGPKLVLREFGPHPDGGALAWLKTSHASPFVAHHRCYASLPPNLDPEALNLERGLALVAEAAGPSAAKPPRRRGRRCGMVSRRHP